MCGVCPAPQEPIIRLHQGELEHQAIPLRLSGLTSGSKTVTVGYTSSSCASATPASNTITVTALPTPTFTTSPTSPQCAGTSVTYTTQTGQSNYVWSVPGTSGTDYTITSGGTGTSDNTVTLKWLTSGSKTVTVGYTAAAVPVQHRLPIRLQ